jgi:hypothetical protein
LSIRGACDEAAGRRQQIETRGRKADRPAPCHRLRDYGTS